jgi:hypothetical protein
MADFTGFYFNNVHSSTYHLIRTSDGDRYSENLFPAFDDRKVELVGGYGSIYDNTRYKEKEFSISVAFDSVTEQDFRAIKQWLVPDKIGELRFDEAPYKAYQAKLKTTPKFEYLCFMRQKENSFYGDEERVYKGEATLDFVAYNPFGYCCDNTTKMTKMGLEEVPDGINWQVLDSYHPLTIRDNNVTEWALTSGLKSKEQLKNYNSFSKVVDNNTEVHTYKTYLYNPGDFEADFKLYINLSGISTESLTGKSIWVKIREKDNPDDLGVQFIFSTDGLIEHNRVLIDTKNHSLQVLYGEGDQLTTQMRYDLITGGSWQKIPKGESEIVIQSTLQITEPIKISYSYKYY